MWEEIEMPVYEFRCKKCDHEFEVIMGMNDDHSSPCPMCESSKTVRVFSPPVIRLRSEQWHAGRAAGAPKQRLDKAAELRDEREKRKKDPGSERERVSNELHLPDKSKGPKRMSGPAPVQPTPTGSGKLKGRTRRK